MIHGKSQKAQSNTMDIVAFLCILEFLFSKKRVDRGQD